MTRRLLNLLVLLSLTAFVMRAADRASPAAPADPVVEPLEPVGEVEGGGLEYSPSFDGNGRSLFSIDKDAVRVWDARTLRPLTDPLHHNDLEFARLVDGGKTLFTAGGTEVRFWDVATSKLRSATKVAARELLFADATPDGTRFTVIAKQATHAVAIWHAGEARPRAVLRHEQPLRCAWFDPGGTRILTHGYGSPFHVWSADTGRELYPSVPSDDRSSAADGSRFDASGNRLVMAQETGVTVIDVTTGRKLADVHLPDPFYTRNVRLSADGKIVAVPAWKVTMQGPVLLFEASTGRQLRQFGMDMFDCQIPSGGRWALCTTVGRKPADVQELWDLGTGTKVQTIETPGRVHFSPDGSMVLIQPDHTFGPQPDPSRTSVWRLRPGGRE